MVYKINNTNQFKIDDRAKISIQLEPRLDGNAKVFYTGKLQFNGTLSIEDGQSFMIFVSDKNYEELQIGPLSNAKNSKRQMTEVNSNTKIKIPLKSNKDGNDNIYYFGELIGKGSLSVNRGLFFTVFTSIKGKEELQISELKINS